MNAQDSRKLIVAISMAAVVGVGVITYAVRPHTLPPVSYTHLTLPTIYSV